MFPVARALSIARSGSSKVCVDGYDNRRTASRRLGATSLSLALRPKIKVWTSGCGIAIVDRKEWIVYLTNPQTAPFNGANLSVPMDLSSVISGATSVAFRVTAEAQDTSAFLNGTVTAVATGVSVTWGFASGVAPTVDPFSLNVLISGTTP